MRAFCRTSTGLRALAIFFATCACIAALSAIALLTPGGTLEPMWRLNPQAHRGFLAMGPWAAPMLLIVAASCLLSAIGLWRRVRWGRWLAITLLSMNLVGTIADILISGDLYSLIGMPVVGVLIWYLLSARIRGAFQSPGNKQNIESE